MDSVRLAPYIIYYASLLASVPLATCYKTIEDVEKKRNFGLVLGLCTSIAICGPGILYSFLMVAGNIVIIKSCDRRSVHHISLGFTWLFLLYLHFHENFSQYTAGLFQILALRLVGLAFEIHIHDKNSNKEDNKKSTTDDDAITKLSAVDIGSYAYFFIGLHKGPYYTWKAYHDHFHSLMSIRGNFRAITEQKLKKAFAFTLIYWLLWLKYPPSMYEQDEFYVNYGTDYRFISSFPHLMMYFLESQIILMISTSASTEAGFGVYPKKCLATPGGGPTVPCKMTGEDSLKDEYNFAMLKCFDNEKLLMGPKMKDTVRGWDMSTRYWFSRYIVNNLVKSNFEVRSACSFLFWTIWVGPTVQNMIKALTLWVYIHLEAEYAVLYSDLLQGPWDLGFAIMRLLCLFYLTPCYIIEDSSVAIKYYNSIYWVYHLVLLFLTVIAIILQKSTRFTPFAQSVLARPDSLQIVSRDPKRSTFAPEAAATSAIWPAGLDKGKPPESGTDREADNEGGPTTSGANADNRPNSNPSKPNDKTDDNQNK